MEASGTSRLRWPVFSLTIFLAALLLFLVQPLIGKYILPWVGGGPAVWNVCMLFFQAILFLGYAYAHLTTTYFAPRSQAIVHLILLLVALVSLPITPDPGLKPEGADNPVWNILLLLGWSIGLPYFLLSTTGPLMQAWLGRAEPDKSPYRLYALSNIGSLNNCCRLTNRR